MRDRKPLATSATPQRRRALARATPLWLAWVLFSGCRAGTVEAPLPPAAAPPAPEAAGVGDAPRPAALRTPRPVIHDSHVHITPMKGPVLDSLRVFEANGIGCFAVKSAGPAGSPRYQATLSLARLLGPRMAFFVNVDWEGHNEPGFIEREVARLEQAMRDGASGVKVFKALGLGIRSADGKLWPVDTPKLWPLWARAGELGAIVALHTADPNAFFEPVSPANERWDELQQAPQWSFHGKDYPPRSTLLRQRNALLERFPKTTFLGIHLANNPEDLAAVSAWLQRYPNLYVDVAARLGEIGRHPREQGRAFFLRHQDRILFGSDFIATPRGMQLGSVTLDGSQPTLADADKFYRAHREFFETDRAGIAHPTPSQGRWTVAAIGLPDPVLAKLYRDNAVRLIFRRRWEWLVAHGQMPVGLDEAGYCAVDPRRPGPPGPARPSARPGPPPPPPTTSGP